MKVLIGTSVNKKNQITDAFLESVSNLKHEGIEVNYLFIDDNEDEESSKLLKEFECENQGVKVYIGKKEDKFLCDDKTHYWTDNLVNKVIEYKNLIISEAVSQDYDYLFLVDSDLILHPKTLNNLISSRKDIISEIFWTSWDHNSEPMPNVWLIDNYSMFLEGKDENLSFAKKSLRTAEFLVKLRKPGIYEVGGLGACTLISKKALNKGVNFNKIHNLSFWSEDRHFCVRCVVLGFHLYVDTHYPAYHLYRDSDLIRLEEYIDSVGVK